uniref:Uncharacterized protein n=1 Tax=Babesia bovis TaxID=5865 RepID=S6BF60_BABBO|nr:hypothetical protein [Babesia bovis]
MSNGCSGNPEQEEPCHNSRLLKHHHAKECCGCKVSNELITTSDPRHLQMNAIKHNPDIPKIRTGRNSYS